MDTKTNKSVVLSAFSIGLMAASGFLLTWTINTLSYFIESGGIFILLLTSVFLYVAGATWMGRIIAQNGKYWKYGGFHNGIVFALLVIGLGIVWLCLNSGMIPVVWKSFFISWPMLLFVIGCSNVCKVHYVPGIILSAIGTFFLIPLFTGITGASFDGQFLSTWWPIFIIIGGLLIFFSILLKPKNVRMHFHFQKKGCGKDYQSPTQEENQDGKVNYKYVFSGAEHVILDPVFKGGTIEAAFGGVDLDLRRTFLAEGETFLYVKATFGGVEIKAPEDWHIEIRSESVFGGVTDDRVKSQQIDFSRKLIVVANCAFGGVTVEN
jgi:predicted membrane protein